MPGQSNIRLGYLTPKSPTNGSITLFTYILILLIFRGCSFSQISFSVLHKRKICNKLHIFDLAKVIQCHSEGEGFFCPLKRLIEEGQKVTDTAIQPKVAFSCVSDSFSPTFNAAIPKKPESLT